MAWHWTGIWSNDGMFYWHKYASLSLNALIPPYLVWQYKIIQHWYKSQRPMKTNNRKFTHTHTYTQKKKFWNNAGLLLTEPLGTNFSETSIGIQTFSFKKMHLNMLSAKWRPFCLGLNVLKWIISRGCSSLAALVYHGSHTQSIKSSPPNAAYLHRWNGLALVQIMACRLFGAKPSSEPMLEYC